MARLGDRLADAAARPGLALLAGEDRMAGTDEQRHRAAARAGARTAVLDGLGHWWMTQDPRRAAVALLDFWGRSEAPLAEFRYTRTIRIPTGASEFSRWPALDEVLPRD